MDEWYGKDFKGSRGAAMVQAAQTLESTPEESFRQDWNLRYLRLYESSPLSNLFQYAGSHYTNVGTTFAMFMLDDPSTWNIARSVIDTTVGQVGRSRPHPKFITIDGTQRQKRRARDATLWCNGWADENSLYQTTYQNLRDGANIDLAGLYMYEDERGKVCIEPLLGSEITVEPFDAMYGGPQTMYRRRLISKAALIRRFPKKKRAISDAPEAQPNSHGGVTGMVMLRESCHLASEDGEPDGWFAAALESSSPSGDGELSVTAYDRTFFTWILFKWEDRLTSCGFYGCSLMSQLYPGQMRVNKMLMRVDKAQNLMCTPRVAVQKGSRIIKSQLSNLIGGAIEYTTTPPTALIWGALPPEFYEWIDKEEKHMYSLTGCNPAAAAGMKDPGVVTEPGIREALDVQQSRQQAFVRRWTDYHLRIFRQLVAMLARRKSKDPYVVKAPGKKAQIIDWAKVKYDEDTFKVDIQPVSDLPLTAQARLEFAQEMMKAGVWDVQRTSEVMEDLDVESAETIEQAITRLIEDDFEAMIVDGEPRHPDDTTPFNLALKTGALWLARGKFEKEPKKHLDLARRYLSELKILKRKLDAQEAAQVPVAAGAPLNKLAPGLAPAAAA